MDRKLPRTAITMLRKFSDLEYHTFYEVMAGERDPLNPDALIRFLLMEGYLVSTSKAADYSKVGSASGETLRITLKGLAQLELDEEEIERRDQDIQFIERQLAEAKEQSAIASTKASTANTIAVFAIIFSVISTVAAALLPLWLTRLFGSLSL